MMMPVLARTVAAGLVAVGVIGCVKSSAHHRDDSPARAGEAPARTAVPMFAAPMFAAPPSPEQLQRACDRGESASCSELSKLYAASPVHTATAAALRAAAMYMDRCAGGDRTACTSLGYLYLRGHGVNKDQRRAASTFFASCKAGEQRACHNLGVAYMNGWGVERDRERAVTLLDKACNGGDMRSCSTLATAYYRALGVAMDQPRAVELYRRACDGNDADGCAAIGVMLARGSGGLEQDVEQGKNLLHQACENGSAHACQHLGGMYQQGNGVARDRRRATSLFMLSCEGGHPRGCHRLSLMGVMDRESARRLGTDTTTTPRGAQPKLETLLRNCARGQARACTALSTNGGVTDPGF